MAIQAGLWGLAGLSFNQVSMQGLTLASLAGQGRQFIVAFGWVESLGTRCVVWAAIGTVDCVSRQSWVP
jgi:hypothetical protein